ncbi:HNH endonuclease [Mycobacterium phage Leozinho]|nr:HNH endonuclease [Mycobacterium phage KingMidas]UVK58872.1 HNH endonuclease [Mycobacterium phage Leozinho]
MNATNTPEEWRPVVGYEGLYEVSDRGRVRSLDRTIQTSVDTRSYKGRVLKPQLTLGYHIVSLTAPGRRRRYAKVHHLVLEAFRCPRVPGMSGCHNNGVKTDNRPENLRWDSHTENMRDTVRHGHHHYAKRNECAYGHPYDESNTLIRPKGGRVCRTCQREYNQNYYAARVAGKQRRAGLT